jgi:glycosyltransferase involved in cell wall biosynthesis
VHRWGYAGLDAVAFTAPEQAVPFVRAGILREHVAVFGIIEGSSHFTPGPRERARQARGVSGSPAVAWVGNLTSGKDPLGALQAFRLALPDLEDPVLWMCFRGGSLEAEVRRRVEDEESLRGRVRLLGPLPHEEMEGFLRAADVLLAPSRHEGSGYSVIEALACGTPVAASDIPPHRAILGSGGAGVVAPAGEPAALARALAAVAANGEQRRAEARRRFEDALSFDAIGRQLFRAYRALAERRGGGRRTSVAEAGS